MGALAGGHAPVCVCVGEGAQVKPQETHRQHTGCVGPLPDSQVLNDLGGVFDMSVC